MTFQNTVLVLTVTVLALLGGTCVFKPLVIAEVARRTHARSRVNRVWPGSSMVLKPWYPTYLRCMGVFMWVFAALLIAALLTGNGD